MHGAIRLTIYLVWVHAVLQQIYIVPSKPASGAGHCGVAVGAHGQRSLRAGGLAHLPACGATVSCKQACHRLLLPAGPVVTGAMPVVEHRVVATQHEC